ncbi:unnamed protein product, partial [Phaeothamnion confervicola]
MTDVFISYAQSDGSLVQRFAECLTESEISVWWDRKLIPGDRFDQEIERMIRQARHVVVIWSKNSVDSRWVRAEADEAFEQRKLIPVRIDECRLPMEFRRVQTAMLTQWSGDQTNKTFRQIVAVLKDSKAPPLPTPSGPANSGAGWNIDPPKFGWCSAAVT